MKLFDGLSGRVDRRWGTRVVTPILNRDTFVHAIKTCLISDRSAYHLFANLLFSILIEI